MTQHTPPKSRRAVLARRTIALGTSLATAALGSAALAAPVVARPGSVQHPSVHLVQQNTADIAVTAGGEGEGAVPEDPKVLLLRNIGRIEGHLRAALALAEAGDAAAVKAQIAQTASPDLAAVTPEAAVRGVDGLAAQLDALNQAVQVDQSADTLRPLIGEIESTLNALRAQMTPHDQTIALAALMRHAGESYGLATTGGTLSSLENYRNSWGYLRVVEAQAQAMAQSSDARVAAAGDKALGYLAATVPAFGDLQGNGITDMRASLIYGAAARIELVALGLQ